jgi:hypothetical protein
MMTTRPAKMPATVPVAAAHSPTSAAAAMTSARLCDDPVELANDRL